MHENKGLLVVFSGPSGSGKDTLLGELNDAADNVQLSVSLTTREKRPMEQDGVHYFFVTREDFERRLANGEILEHTQYNGQYYGTPKSAVDEWLAQGKTVILEIEVEGAGSIRRIYPDCVSVFLLPPSVETLRQRLRGRQSNSEEDIARRIGIAKEEMPHALNYDYVILNDRLADAVSDFRAIIRAERLRVQRRKNLINEVIHSA